MKKFFFTAAAIVCAVLLSVSLTSCGNDDDSDLQMTTMYHYGGTTQNEYTYFSHAESGDITKSTYEALYKELKTILAGEEWNVKYTKSNQDEVLKREDENARKKYATMESKVMDFKKKIDNLDKTLDKNKFDFSLEVVMSCKCELPTGTKTLESRMISIKYQGIQ